MAQQPPIFGAYAVSFSSQETPETPLCLSQTQAASCPGTAGLLCVHWPQGGGHTPRQAQRLGYISPASQSSILAHLCSLTPSLWLHRSVAVGQAWSLGFPQPQHTSLLPTLWLPQTQPLLSLSGQTPPSPPRES